MARRKQRELPRELARGRDRLAAWRRTKKPRSRIPERLPKELETIVANCLAHARRQFVEVYDCFPEECRTVLDVLKVVYRNDAIAGREGMTAGERLQLHRARSEPTMTNLRP